MIIEDNFLSESYDGQYYITGEEKYFLFDPDWFAKASIIDGTIIFQVREDVEGILHLKFKCASYKGNQTNKDYLGDYVLKSNVDLDIFYFGFKDDNTLLLYDSFSVIESVTYSVNGSSVVFDGLAEVMDVESAVGTFWDGAFLLEVKWPDYWIKEGEKEYLVQGARYAYLLTKIKTETTPYLGTYTETLSENAPIFANANIELILNSDNHFTLTVKNIKSEIQASGEYFIVDERLFFIATDGLGEEGEAYPFDAKLQSGAIVTGFGKDGLLCILTKAPANG